MKLTLYHGSDHIVQKPLYGVGKKDNDYGSGFYTTEDKQKADEWAVTFGNDNAVTNRYSIDTANLSVLQLDDYGQLAWVAEIIANRGARGETARILGKRIVDKYKVDTSKADIIIGYRADDSYIDIVDAFLQNQISLDEVDRLFRKGELGQQVFIKSEAAFANLKFEGYEYVPKGLTNESEVRARIDVSRFLKNRATQIALNGYQPYGLTAREVAMNHYVYHPDIQYYDIASGNDYEEGDYEREDGTDYDR